MDVAEPGCAEEPAVRDRAGGDVQRDADEARAGCVSKTGRCARQGCSGGGSGGGGVVGGGGAGAVGGGGSGVGFGFGFDGFTWNPPPPLLVVVVCWGETPLPE
jgi:hypothetical protein